VFALQRVFLLWPLTVLTRQTRQTVHAIKQTILNIMSMVSTATITIKLKNPQICNKKRADALLSSQNSQTFWVSTGIIKYNRKELMLFGPTFQL
jgi:hypothetical protein